MRQFSPKRIAKQVLLGTMFGDAHVQRTSRTKALLSLTQGVVQLPYLLWKLQALSPFIGDFTMNHFGGDDNDHWKASPRFKASSRSLTYLGHIRDDFYALHDGVYRKVVRMNVLRRLTPLALAVWYMDDGSIGHQNGAVFSARLHTNGFTQDENTIIQQYFRERWNIEFGVHKDTRSNTSFLIARKEPTQAFLAMIRPYVLPCMMYKVEPSHYSAEPRMSEDDIVRTLQQCKELRRNTQPLAQKLTNDEKLELARYVCTREVTEREVKSWRTITPARYIRISDTDPSILSKIKAAYGGNLRKRVNQYGSGRQWEYLIGAGKAVKMFDDMLEAVNVR